MSSRTTTTSRRTRKNLPRSRGGIAGLAESPEFKTFRGVLRNNLLIAVVVGVMIVYLLPLFAQTFGRFLWIYSHDNIRIPPTFFQGIFDVGAGITPGGLGILEGFITIIIQSVLGIVFGELKWIATWIGRIARFAYLTILSLLVIYLVMFLILSFILQNKIRSTAILISWIISSLTALGIAFFLIPNNDQLLQLFRNYSEQIEQTEELLREIPLILIDVVYNFYIGFLILIPLHFGLTMGTQYLLRNF